MKGALCAASKKLGVSARKLLEPVTAGTCGCGVIARNTPTAGPARPAPHSYRQQGSLHVFEQSTRFPAPRRAVGRCDGRLRGLPARDPQCAGDAGRLPHGHDPRRRARRDLHAGKPFVRPLLRRAARRAWLQRPAPAPAAERRTGVAAAAGIGVHEELPFARPRSVGAVRAAVLPRSEADDRIPAGHQPRLEQRPPVLEQRPVGPVGEPEAGRADDGLPEAPGPHVPLRTGRRVHDLRFVLLLRARRHRAEPHLPVDRHGRPAQHLRHPAERPGHRRARRRERLHVDDLRRAPREREDQLEGVPGRHGHPGRPDRQLHRQLADVLQEVPGEGRRERPVGRQGRVGPHARRAEGRRAGEPAAAGVVDRRAVQVQRAPAGVADRRRVLHQHGARGADVEPGGVGEDGVHPQLRRERRAVRSRRRRCRRSRAAWAARASCRRTCCRTSATSCST